MSTESEILIPIANEQAIGLGVGRRSIGRRIKGDPEFPKTIRIGGRLYVTKAELDAYKQRLIQRAFVESTKEKAIAAQVLEAV